MKTVSIGGHAPTMLTPLGQHRTIPALRLKHRSGGSPRQEPPQAAVALRSASLRLGVRHGNCVAKMLDNVGLRYPHRASGAKAPRTLRPLPLLRFAVSATGGAHLCSTKYYLRFWLSICRTSLAVSALRIMRYCPRAKKCIFVSLGAKMCFLRRGESKGGVRGRVSDASPSGACNRTSGASSAGWRPLFWPPSGRSVAQPQATNPSFERVSATASPKW